MPATIFGRLFGKRGVLCQEGHSHGPKAGEPNAETHPTAFPEHTHQVPLTPGMDKSAGYSKYEKYDEFKPKSLPQLSVSLQREFEDHTKPKTPFTGAFDFINQLKITEEQVNQTYERNLKFHMGFDGNEKPHYSTGWEKAVAYHHGLYVPETCTQTKTADDIRLAVADFTEKVHRDAPKDACKYLQIEEFRCLNTYQYESHPAFAAKKCMKWWDELQKCQWDQEKFNTGTTYIEGPQMRRRRPYIFYPDFKYA